MYGALLTNSFPKNLINVTGIFVDDGYIRILSSWLVCISMKLFLACLFFLKALAHENIFANSSAPDLCNLEALRALDGEIISPRNDGTRPSVFHEHSSLVERLPDGLVRKTLRPTSRSSREELLLKLTHEADMLSQLRYQTSYTGTAEREKSKASTMGK